MRIFYPKKRRLGACRLSHDPDDKLVLLSFEQKRRRRDRFGRSHRFNTQQTSDDLIILRGVQRQFVEKGRYFLYSCMNVVLGCQPDAGPEITGQRIERRVRKKLLAIRLDNCGLGELGLAASSRTTRVLPMPASP